MLSRLKGIALPSTSEFVLVDNTLESELPTQSQSRIPLTMWIDYGGRMPNPPVVTLLINPQTMNSSFSKKVNASFTRGGFIVEQWGENLDVLNFSGTIGAYYVISNSTAGTGLNRYDRSKSYSFRNLMEIFLIYRNNGSIYLNSAKKPENNQKAKKQNKLVDSAGYKRVDQRVPNSLKTTKTRISSVGDVYLQYDRTLYLGSFDTFSIEEDASRPFSLSYNFSFTVLRRSIADNRVEAYYNQVALEFEDHITSTRGSSAVSQVVNKYIETERNAKDLESITNPNTFNTNINRQNMPSAMLANANKILDSKGYTATGSQQATYYNSFKELSGDQTYKESEKTKNDIYNNTYNVVDAKDDRSPAEKAQDARELSDAMANYANYIKGSGAK